MPELTDLKNIPFAWNIKDWTGHKVDSLSMDIYYPTGATSDKKVPGCSTFAMQEIS